MNRFSSCLMALFYREQEDQGPENPGPVTLVPSISSCFLFQEREEEVREGWEGTFYFPSFLIARLSSFHLHT